mgnify:CR=1 FL=1
MQNIDFIKMHGLGNDFVIIDRRINNVEISKEFINKLSDRKSGAGCDQLITINHSSSDDHHAYIQIYNPGGDSAEACGNGTRCVAKLLFEEKNNSELKIKSDAGILIAKKNDDKNISVNLGRLSHHWQDIPLIKKVDTLNMPIDIPNQHRGNGKKFLNLIFKKYMEYANVFLEVKKTNFPAINLYLNFGFEEIDRKRMYYSDGQDAIVMSRIVN